MNDNFKFWILWILCIIIMFAARSRDDMLSARVKDLETRLLLTEKKVASLEKAASYLIVGKGELQPPPGQEWYTQEEKK